MEEKFVSTCVLSSQKEERARNASLADSRPPGGARKAGLYVSHFAVCESDLASYNVIAASAQGYFDSTAFVMRLCVDIATLILPSAHYGRTASSA